MQGVFNLDRSAKAIIAGAIAFASALASGYDDSLLTSSEKVAAVGAGIIALAGVWAFPNKYVKAGIAAVVAGLAALGVALQDDSVSAQEWITIILAVLVALYAVYEGVPNAEETAPAPKA
jgi:hypothetical protein